LIEVTSSAKLVLCEDLNEHEGAEADDFAGVHGAHGYGS